MKKSKFHSGKLHTNTYAKNPKFHSVKLRKKGKKNMLNIKPGDFNEKTQNEEDSDDEEFQSFMNQQQQKKGGGGPRFSPAEDTYILFKAKKQNYVLSMDDLERIAKKCNKKFHEGRNQRTGHSLWYHIKRDRKRGEDSIFSMVKIPGKSPQYHKPEEPIQSSPEKRIPSATKQTQGNPNKNRSVESHKSGNTPIVVMLRDSKGNIEKFVTQKFKSFEELMFAIV